MNDDPFANAPDVNQHFVDAERGPEAMPDVPHDAERWEPWDDEQREEPSEKHYRMDLTPGGTIEQEVHQEIDSGARARIIQAQREAFDARDLAEEKELDFAGDFESARRNDRGFDPDSAREYEEWSRRQDAERFRDTDEMVDDMYRHHHGEERER